MGLKITHCKAGHEVIVDNTFPIGYHGELRCFSCGKKQFSSYKTKSGVVKTIAYYTPMIYNLKTGTSQLEPISDRILQNAIAESPLF